MRPAFARGGNEPLGDCLDLRSVDSSDLLNAFPDQAAIIDQSGQILAVNAAWEAFAHENGGTPASTGVGANYFASCDAAVLQDRDRETDPHFMAVGRQRSIWSCRMQVTSDLLVGARP